MTFNRMGWAKPGAKAVIRNVSSIGARRLPGDGQTVVIVRETPTQFVTAEGRRWRKTDGVAIGGGGGNLEPISWLIGQRCQEAGDKIHRRINAAWRGGGEREALLDVAAIVAAAIADIDELEAPAKTITEEQP